MNNFLELLPYILVSVILVAFIGGFILPLVIVIFKAAWQLALM